MAAGLTDWQGPKAPPGADATDLPVLADHLWILSSGTTGNSKWIALAKKAFMAAAAGANQFLQSNAHDNWLNILPLHHVGGLSILARAELSGARVTILNGPWQPLEFVAALKKHAITLTSLVPTQVVDLVQGQLPAPASVRAILVGGGALKPDIYRAARQLGWPLLPSFGMTECCSQIATAPLRSLGENAFPGLQLLPHIEARVVEGVLQLRTPALFTAAWQAGQLQPALLEDGWWASRDRADLRQGKWLTPLGRVDDCVKVKGMLVDLFALEQRLNLAVVALPSPRREHDLVAVTEGSLTAAEVEMRAWNAAAVNHERIRAVYRVASMPRTELGKIKRAALLETLAVAAGPPL